MMDLRKVYESGSVLRFHTIADYSGGHRQTVADHSWGVILIAYELAQRRNYRYELGGFLLRAALLHDVEEHVLGDIPATAKWRFPSFAKANVEAENVVRKELQIEYPDLDEEGTQIVKWADALELYAYSSRKALAGNHVYYKVVENIYQYMRKELPQWSEAINLMQELS